MSIIHNGLQNLRPVNNANLLSARAQNYGYYPLITGDTTPAFYLPAEKKLAGKPDILRFQRDLQLSVDDYLDKPLVIAFFYAQGNISEQIKNIESLRADIKVMGGRFIIITAMQPKQLKPFVKNYDNLTIVYDKDNEIAEAFGLYDATNPLWQWASGIEDENLAMPAFYVISPDRQIAYHHVDYSLGLVNNNNYYSLAFARELLTAVYNTAQRFTYQPVQYRSVS